MSTFGPVAATALLPEFSRAPSAIHWRSRLIASSGSCGEDGGMNGVAFVRPSTWVDGAVVGVAGLDEGAGAAALHDLGEVVAVTDAALLVGVMAG